MDIFIQTGKELMLLIAEALMFITNPNKRIYWLYLLSSAVIALVFLCPIKKQSTTVLIKKLISKNIWLHPSSLVDYQWLVANHIVRIMLIVPLLGSQISVALWVNRQLISLCGEGNWLHWPTPYITAMFTLTIFMVEDFSRFLLHYAHHKIPWLWHFHQVHHSATLLTPVTLYRIHFVEMFLSSIRSTVSIGVTSGVFIYLFEGSINLMTVIGVNIFSFAFNLLGANLRHSSIYIGFGKLEHLLISPAQHQIHHSINPSHWDKNFGAALSIWDKLFGSLIHSKNETVDGFGIDANSQSEVQRLRLW